MPFRVKRLRIWLWLVFCLLAIGPLSQIAPRIVPWIVPAAAAQDLAAVQQELADLGLDPGPIDGLIGPRTRAALFAFQAEKGLPGTGKLDTATLRSLLGVDRLAAPAGGRTRPPNTVMGPPLDPVPLTPVERAALSTAAELTAPQSSAAGPPSLDTEIETAASIGDSLPALQLPEDPAAGDTASTRWWILAIVIYVLLLIVRSRRRRAAKEEPAAEREPAAASPQLDEPIRPPTPRPRLRRRNAFAPPPRPASAMRAARR